MSRARTLSITVRNQPGVLTKIAGMFYRRDCNIETLTVGKTHIDGLSKIVISVSMTPDDLELLRRQIENLVDVERATVLDDRRSIEMEMCLIRVGYSAPADRLDILASARPYQPRVRGGDATSVTLEVADRTDVIDDFVAVMGRYRILDVSRTGMTALGAAATSDDQVVSNQPFDPASRMAVTQPAARRPKERQP